MSYSITMREALLQDIAQLKRERDEAREALDAVMGWAPQAPDYFNDKTKARWDDDMRKALKVLEATK